MTRKKILIVIGTRPEAIKMAPVVHALAQRPALECRVCITSQHREMLKSVLDLFGIIPDYDLDIMRPGQDLASLSARLLDGFSALLAANRPDLVLVHGDTTSAMMAALCAYYLHIPVGHVEAGLRTHDKLAPFPEEINRQFIDRIADLSFAPTQTAAAVLAAEGVNPAQIHMTGNTIVDAVMEMSARLRDRFPPDAPHEDFILVTGHRRESFGVGFESICRALRQIAAAHPGVKIIYPVHPNPNVQEPVCRILGAVSNITLPAPQDYLSFLGLMMKCRFLISDSGGIQEEACVLKKPVLLMRDVTERPEAVEAGFVKLVGADTARIVENANRLLSDRTFYEGMIQGDNPYGDGSAGVRIAGVVEKFYAVGEA